PLAPGLPGGRDGDGYGRRGHADDQVRARRAGRAGGTRGARPAMTATHPIRAAARIEAYARMFLLRASLLLAAAAPAADAQPTAFAPLVADGPITYHIAEGAPGSMYRESDRQLALWALDAWRRAAGDAFELVEAPEDEATLRIYFVPASAGQYGEMR